MNYVSTVYAAATTNGVDISNLEDPAKSLTGIKSIGGLLTSNSVNILNLVFIFTGLFFFANLILAGWDYMMSSGDPKRVAAASSRITNGFIGLIMTLMAFIIVRIVVSVLGLAPVI